MHTTHRRPLRRALATAGTLAAAFALAACSAGSPAPSPEAPTPVDTAAAQPSTASATDALLSEYGLEGLDAREVIDTMDALPVSERPADLMLSIRPNELIVKGADGEEGSLPMPEDAFYVSIAPYIDDTHDCYYHSLTTCKGEMSEETVHVLVTDADTGDVILDEERTTFDNGFMGLWLPRDIDATVTIESDGRSATATLPTRSVEDATCVTTMRLA